MPWNASKQVAPSRRMKNTFLSVFSATGHRPPVDAEREEMLLRRRRDDSRPEVSARIVHFLSPDCNDFATRLR